MVTIHPSAILRAGSDARAEMRDSFVRDVRVFADALAP